MVWCFERTALQIMNTLPTCTYMPNDSLWSYHGRWTELCQVHRIRILDQFPSINKAVHVMVDSRTYRCRIQWWIRIFYRGRQLFWECSKVRTWISMTFRTLLNVARKAQTACDVMMRLALVEHKYQGEHTLNVSFLVWMKYGVLDTNVDSWCHLRRYYEKASAFILVNLNLPFIDEPMTLNLGRIIIRNIPLMARFLFSVVSHSQLSYGCQT